MTEQNKEPSAAASLPRSTSGRPRCALITGASQGLGRAFAEECAGRGMSLVLVALPDTGLGEVAAVLRRAYEVPIETVEIDLTRPEAPAQIASASRARGFDVDTLINNAGVGFTSRFSESSASQNEVTIQLNVAALVRLTQEMLPRLQERRRGWILNVASMGAFFPMPSMPVYSSTKTFVLTFTRLLRAELRGTSVSVSALCPNGIRTNRATRDVIARQGWAGRVTCRYPDEVARTALRGLFRGACDDRAGNGQPHADRRCPVRPAGLVHAGHLPPVGNGAVQRGKEAAHGCRIGGGHRMNAMIAVVTGATSGIGREVALLFAKRGMRVLGVGRSLERCRQTGHELRDATGNSSVEFLPADLSSLEEVRRLAAEIGARAPRVDVLVNNAGLFTFSRTETVDGLETQLAVNWLAGFALTGLLLEQLQRSPGPRIVNVSSGSHYAGRMHWDDLGLRHGYQGLKAYDQSKLAMVLFTAELARRLRGPRSPAAYAVDPGLVKTDFASKGNNVVVTLVWKIRTRNGISARQAAESVAWCATSPDAQGMSGLYWKERSTLVPSEEARDPAAARRLWETGERLSGVRYPKEGTLALFHAAET